MYQLVRPADQNIYLCTLYHTNQYLAIGQLTTELVLL